MADEESLWQAVVCFVEKGVYELPGDSSTVVLEGRVVPQIDKDLDSNSDNPEADWITVNLFSNGEVPDSGCHPESEGLSSPRKPDLDILIRVLETQISAVERNCRELAPADHSTTESPDSPGLKQTTPRCSAADHKYQIIESDSLSKPEESLSDGPYLQLSGSPFFWTWFLNLSASTPKISSQATDITIGNSTKANRKLSDSGSDSTNQIPVPLSCLTRWFPVVQVYPFSSHGEVFGEPLLKQLLAEKNGSKTRQLGIYTLLDSNAAIYNQIQRSSRDYQNAYAKNSDGDLKLSLPLWASPAFPPNGFVGPGTGGGPPTMRYAVSKAPGIHPGWGMAPVGGKISSESRLEKFLLWVEKTKSIEKPGKFKSEVARALECSTSDDEPLSRFNMHSGRMVEVNQGEAVETVLRKTGWTDAELEEFKASCAKSNLKGPDHHIFSDFEQWCWKTAQFFGLTEGEVRCGFEVQKRAIKRIREKETFDERMFPEMLRRVLEVQGQSQTESKKVEPEGTQIESEVDPGPPDSVMDIDMRLWDKPR